MPYKLTNPSANDRPEVNLILDGSHGAQKARTIRPDTNRPDPIAGFVYAASEALLLPHGLGDAALHLVSLALLGGFIASIAYAYPSVPLLVCLGFSLFAALGFTAAAVVALPQLLVPAALKLIALFTGALLTITL